MTSRLTDFTWFNDPSPPPPPRPVAVVVAALASALLALVWAIFCLDLCCAVPCPSEGSYSTLREGFRVGHLRHPLRHDRRLRRRHPGRPPQVRGKQAIPRPPPPPRHASERRTPGHAPPSRNGTGTWPEVTRKATIEFTPPLPPPLQPARAFTCAGSRLPIPCATVAHAWFGEGACLSRTILLHDLDMYFISS